MGHLQLNEVELTDFRNHEEWKESLSPGLTVIVGRNAAGKTNVLEGIAVAATGDSFRHFQWGDLVRQGQDRASVVLRGTRERVPFTATVEISSGGIRTHGLDGERRRPGTISQSIPVVTFVPEDLALSKGPAEDRRAAIDRIGDRLSAAYLKVRREYSRVLRQRNHVLKSGGTEGDLAAWDEATGRIGAALVIQRARLLDRMERRMCESHAAIGGEERMSVLVSPSWSEESMTAREVSALGRDRIEELIAARIGVLRTAERERRHSLVGPHRDDISLELDGKNARLFASQGQHRTIALSWKAAEVAVVEHVTGVTPVLLLDDVMSELDEWRRAALSREVIAKGQAIVTTTTLDYFTEETLSSACVVSLGSAER